VRATVTTEIAAPPQLVFDTMADARNEPLWNDQVSRSELVGGETIGHGSTFRTVNKDNEYDSTIVTYERPTRVAFRVLGPPLDIDMSFDVAGHDGHTHLTSTFDMRPRGMLRAMFVVMSPLIRKDLAIQSASFKALCERLAAG
jgi:hypothetical protein